jgi:putative transposase
MDWKQLLAYITASVDQQLLLRHEYVITENRILCQQIPGRVRLGDEECKRLAEIGQELGKQALAEVATIVKPDTILAWHRRLMAQKFNGSQQRKAPGHPQIDEELETWVIRLAQENRTWGYDRFAGVSSAKKVSHVPVVQAFLFSLAACIGLEVSHESLPPPASDSPALDR